MFAVHNNRLPAVRVLLRAGADTGRTRSNTTAVAMHFVRTGEAVALLFDAGADIDPRSNVHGFTPLHRAVYDAHYGAVEALVARGADVNAAGTGYRNTILHRALTPGDKPAVRLRMARLLVGAGARVNARNSENVTPLFIAAKRHGPAIVELLLDAGADPAAVTKPAEDNPRGWTIAGVAAGKSRLRGTDALRRLEEGCAADKRCAAAAWPDGVPARLAGGGERKTPAAEPASGSCSGHVVKASERRLGDVALAALGDRSRWPEIARLNGITAENPHRAGQCLKLPAG